MRLRRVKMRNTSGKLIEVKVIHKNLHRENSQSHSYITQPKRLNKETTIVKASVEDFEDIISRHMESFKFNRRTSRHHHRGDNYAW